MNDQVEQLTFQFARAGRLLRDRLAGIRDDEYLWEPVDGCWSIRRRELATSPAPGGRGGWVFDYSAEQPSPPPLTTIAWRLTHLTDVLGSYHDHLFGAGQQDDDWLEVPSTAGAGVALWQRYSADFAAALAGDDDERLRQPIRIPWWPESAPRWGVVANVITEAVHHGAEIGVLRDLYRERSSWRG